MGLQIVCGSLLEIDPHVYHFVTNADKAFSCLEVEIQGLF
jgi:hypothetical protein